ncbi:hypothetical protein HR45_15720 [Shewanella mangrovi]|uniref:TonB-dependent receptor n=1 Tax=Shewanella mangrovi TaxID=1515746 RepID=A0A094JBD8_9GAMM|nr:TonB-dependent receptor [Shewanella mangrovi]KFZ36577.1 hypothetical protein HR45_15720 [Shewanella mangrovi]
MMQSVLLQPRLSSLAKTVGVALGVVTLFAGQAMAEDASPAEKNKAEKENSIEKIVVTASKRSERLQDVALSMAVLDAKALAETGKSKLADYFAEIPGLSYVSSAMSSTIVMRGVGTDAGIGTRPTSGVTIDDVPYGSATNTGVIPDLDPSDIQQIEVLRGPQGTLYGASSMGGLVKYVSVDPNASYATGHFELGGASAAHGSTGHSIRASGNLPVTDDFAIRMSGFKREDPAYLTNTRDGSDNSIESDGGRIAMIWHMTDDWTFRSSAMFQNTSQDNTAYADVTSELEPIYGQYEHSRGVDTDSFAGQTRFYTAKLTGDLGWGTFDSITGYTEHRAAAKQDVGYTSIGNFAPMFANMFGLGYQEAGAFIDNRYDEDKISQEFRLSSKDDVRFQWQVGLFYTKESVDSTQTFYLSDNASGDYFADVPLLTSLGDDSYKESAIFVNTTYKITDQWDVTVGGRFAKNKIEGTGYGGGMLTDESTTTDSYSDDVFTYLLATRYHFNEDMMLFGRISSGYRAGGGNSTIVEGIPESYDSDSLVSYEVGFKGGFFENALNLNATAYYIDWSDLQISQVDLTYGSSYTTNAGKAASQGLELGMGYTFLEDWQFNVNYAFTDASLAEDIPGYVEGSTAYGKDGDRMPFSAKNSGTVSLQHSFDLGNGSQLSIGGNVTYMGDRYMQFTQSADISRIHLPSYTTVGLSSTLKSGDWSLTVYANNLFDEVGYISANRRGTATAATDVNYGAVVIQPQTIGLTLAWDL